MEDSTGKTALQYWKENGYDDDDDENEEENENDQDISNGSDTSSCTGPATAVQVQPE
jgi:hypothetical protein